MVVAAKRAARRDGVRVFRHFVWLEAGSVKMALSHPAHQRVTQTVGRLQLSGCAIV